MGTALEKFRRASRGRGRRGRGRRYSEEQQAPAICHAAQERRQGRSGEEVALELGVHPLTLRRWVQQEQSFRRVEVTESQPRGSSVVVTPDGFRVEGVGSEEIAKLVPNDGTPSYDTFGNALAIDGRTALAVVERDDMDLNPLGAAYVFDASGWSDETKRRLVVTAGSLVEAERAREPHALHEWKQLIVARLPAVRRLAARLVATRRRRLVLLSASLFALTLILSPAVWLVHRVYFYRAIVRLARAKVQPCRSPHCGSVEPRQAQPKAA